MRNSGSTSQAEDFLPSGWTERQSSVGNTRPWFLEILYSLDIMTHKCVQSIQEIT